MARKPRIVKFTDSELSKVAEQEGTLSDWGKAEDMAEAEIEARIASDIDEESMVIDWSSASIEMPLPKAAQSSSAYKKTR